MVKKWIREALGIEALVEELRLERSGQREMMAQVLRTSEAQAKAVDGVIGVMNQIYASYQTDGSPPEERHINEEIEDAILTKSFYGSDESDDGA